MRAKTLRAILQTRGITVRDDYLEAVAAAYSVLQPELDRLRRVRLEFLPPYIEPSTCLRWIERGGRSR